MLSALLMCLALLRDSLPVRSEFGPRLASVYAPIVLASFGSGPNMVAVLATAPDGAAAYRSAAGGDLPVPDAELRLITCGGTFDPETGHYLSNVIVSAVLASGGHR